MNLFDLNSDNIVMNIDGKDIEMKHPICYDKVINKWLVSKCGKVWSLAQNKMLSDRVRKGDVYIKHCISTTTDFWKDGSGRRVDNFNLIRRDILQHKLVIDTWAPLYDNPPKGISWEQWEIVRKLDTVYNHISKTVCIDHIDDDPENNHVDNLRRVTDWDNQKTRKARGI